MAVYPVNLERRNDNQILIEWNDGQKRQYSARELRDQCACATCREKHGAKSESPAALLPIISEAEAQPLAIKGMKPVGNYAYSIDFSDGHDTGFYTLEFLHEAGRVAE